jgi:tetratricopeptide (TPR) repeat protein
VELVLNNPFRVLGLPATASTRDITKRISDLETFAELGKAKSYPHDFPGLGALDRSLEAIKDAARKIEQAEGRLFHSFFWFRLGDSVDELALDSLAAGNIDEAVELWDKQLGKKGTKKYTWRLNRGVLRFVRANGRTLDKDEMDEALEDLGFVIDDDLDDSIQEVLGGNESGVNRESLWRRVVDELVGVAQSYSTNPYGKNAVRIVESLWSFPSEARDYASSKILNPLIEEINQAIKVSEDLRANDDLESLKVKNRLDKVEKLIWDLKEILGEDDIRFQTVANAYADEVCACAVKALNDFKNPKLSMMLIQWAASLPSFSRIKSRIEENLETIQEWVEDDEEDEIFGEIVKKLKVDVYTLTQAANLLEEMKRLLGQIKAKVGGGDKRYLKISSACAHHILGFLIDTVNSAQDTFDKTKNLTDLQSTIGGSTGLTRKLLLLDLDVETRTRVNKNLETIEGIDTRLTAAMTARANHSASSSNIFEQIPGWLWLVGIVLLISMCSGK